ncbi:Coenzyme F420 hydrogenase/dehydrogenase, beta subunit C-terminal domain [Phocaeicola plebeius]|jgi:coenzyme F420-reducing hydrogenase beta subunit|uniref:4Fe-4S dicluster domain-containing protein n=1 Tax=Phocaeicola plebeius TaxID=310297 RepID=A0A3E4W8E1_9BACT|nr:Coenzyme F420 hydrogenase/dehydrogenase, beta subunit C-terminal domain [Phocaeicola plebeius]RGM38496.1 4Fe-4S dicluster domain-containing protein [Phocaeicola plebeius]
MKHIDALNNKYSCSGCTACAQSCPKQCITMSSDYEGFKYPIVDETRCIQCGICIKVCPWRKEKYQRPINCFTEPIVYAAKCKDKNIRLNSTSGGIFTVLSDYILQLQGGICGAVYNTSTQKVEHTITFTTEGRNKMRGSKYVQSELSNTFQDIKTLLEQDKWLLFTGTPCQTAGLLSFLKKDYPKLVIVDILCHSVPSPLILHEILKKYAPTNISFRDKSLGWRKSYSFQIKENNKIIHNNTFLNLFFKGLINRPSCYNCIFTNTYRASDLTIGDYWNIKAIDSKFEDPLGVSCILINSPKGKYIFEQIQNKIENIRTDLKPALQACLQQHTTEPVQKRRKFWTDYQEKGFDYCNKNYGYYTPIENIKANILAPIARKTGISKLLRVIKK